MLVPYGALGLPAGAISLQLAVAPSSLSFHLQQMTQGRVLLQRRSSRPMIYAVNDEIIGSLCRMLTHPEPGCRRAAAGCDINQATLRYPQIGTRQAPISRCLRQLAGPCGLWLQQCCQHCRLCLNRRQTVRGQMRHVLNCLLKPEQHGLHLLPQPVNDGVTGHTGGDLVVDFHATAVKHPVAFKKPAQWFHWR